MFSALFSVLKATDLGFGITNIISGSTPKNEFLYKSETFSLDILYWDNSTRAQLEEQFGSNLTFASIVFAVLQILADFFTSLLVFFARDLMFMCSVCVYQLNNEFVSRLDTLLSPDLVVLDPDVLKSVVQDYEVFFGVTRKINLVFDKFFKLVHLDNLLLCAYFVLEIMNGRFTGISATKNFIRVAKIVAVYYLAMNSSNTVRRKFC